MKNKKVCLLNMLACWDKMSPKQVNFKKKAPAKTEPETDFAVPRKGRRHQSGREGPIPSRRPRPLAEVSLVGHDLRSEVGVGGLVSVRRGHIRR